MMAAKLDIIMECMFFVVFDYITQSEFHDFLRQIQLELMISTVSCLLNIESTEAGGGWIPDTTFRNHGLSRVS